MTILTHITYQYMLCIVPQPHSTNIFTSLISNIPRHWSGSDQCLSSCRDRRQCNAYSRRRASAWFDRVSHHTVVVGPARKQLHTLQPFLDPLLVSPGPDPTAGLWTRLRSDSTLSTPLALRCTSPVSRRTPPTYINYSFYFITFVNFTWIQLTIYYYFNWTTFK